MNDLRTAAQQALEALNIATLGTLTGKWKLGEKAMKDLRAALAEPQGEPVAWRISYPNDPELGFWFAEGIGGEGCLSEPLYTTPQPAKREPLTREEIDAVMRQALGYGLSPSRDDLELVRAIERAHGITGEQP